MMVRWVIFPTCLIAIMATMLALGQPVVAAVPSPSPGVVPRPTQMALTPTAAPFVLSATTRIVTTSEPAARDAGRFLQRWLREDASLNLRLDTVHQTAKSLPNTILLTTMRAPMTLGDAGYSVHVMGQSVTIAAPQGASLFYGGETFRQLVPLTGDHGKWTVPALSITDQPRFGERSLMIDSARHFQSLEFLKRTLDLLAYLKMNTFHWHLTDDQGWRLEIKKYPRLTSVGAFRSNGGVRYGAFYTQEQVRDLVAYAAARHITIIPEIDMPAHSLALLAAYPQYACFPRDFQVPSNNVSMGKTDVPWTPDVLDPAKKDTYTFVEDILTEVMALFPSVAIHIGGDECPIDTWKRSPDCQAKIKELGLKDERALQNYFTQRIAVFLAAHGRRLQGWNEILDGGALPKAVIVEPWNRSESAATAAKAGNDVVVASTRYGYFDYNNDTTSLMRAYEWDPMPAGLGPDEASHIKGLEACLWTEGKYGDADADAYLWPRTIATAEAGWSPQEQRDWSDFRARLRSSLYPRLAHMGLGDPLPKSPAAVEAALVERSDFNPGVKIGEWLPARMSETFETLEWDVTRFLVGAGKYTLRLKYDTGADGIAASEVDLTRNGSEVVARDMHESFAGSNSHDQRYTLDLATLDPTAKYAVHVRLRSDGGIDSKGTLFLTAPDALDHTSTPATTVPAAVDPASVANPVHADSFALESGKFVLNGQPFQIISGEMHYERIPREYWRQRLRMARAMGLNTIATYVFWNIHEPEKGRWHFSGDADLAAFIRTAQQEGLYVLLRTGPYACAEWEFGGYPYWLLNEKTDGKPLVIRSTDPHFLRYSGLFLDQVGRQCASLQAGRTGGNILMVQVENEYGSFGKDKTYMAAIRDQIRHAGFTVPLYTADGPSQASNGCIDGALPGLDGADSETLTADVDKVHPGGPYFASEVYPGWLDHWGEKFNRYSPQSGTKLLTSFVSKGYSVNLYMFHGGTNFGFMNGANMGGSFEPSITSYDYGAPLDEAGRPTAMYDAMRNALLPLLPAGSVPPVPAVSPAIAIPQFTLTQSGSLLGALPTPVKSVGLRTMEDLHQDYGYVLYRTHLIGPRKATLTIEGLRDYAVVLVNGKTVGTLDRRRKQKSLPVDIPAGAVLDILVENAGRINYGSQIQDNHKGITGAVRLDGDDLSVWEIYSLPMHDPARLRMDGKKTDGPAFYQGIFDIDAAGDTFLDMRAWTKGIVWVNGHNLGRYWFIGPQQTLYVPGPWLKRGRNQVTVFEQGKVAAPRLAGLTAPILEQLVPEPPLPTAIVPKRPKWSQSPKPSPTNLVVQGDFSDPTSGQTVSFLIRHARYVCFESTSAWDGSAFASCSEFFLIGPNGKTLPRGAWRIAYADSEEEVADDNRAENMIDGDSETFWHSVWGRAYTGHPHFVVIDTGASQSVTGFRYEPRQSGDPGRIKGYRFFASETPFGAKSP